MGDRRIRRTSSPDGPVSAPPPRARLVTIRLLRLAIAASLLWPMSLFAYASWVSHREIAALADERIERSLDVIHEQAVNVFQSIDLALDNVEELLSGRSNADIRADEPALQAKLKRIVGALPAVQSIWVFDESGRALVSTLALPAPNPPEGYAGRDYFRAHVQSHVGTYVGDILTSKFNGTQFFGVSRRRETSQGAFAGVIEASILPADFDRFYGSISRNRALCFALIREDGTFLARYPGSLKPSLRLDDGTAFRQHVASPAEGALFTAQSPVDGVEQRIGIRKLGALPLYVDAAIDTDAIAQEWLAGMAPHLIFGLPATLFLFVTLAVVLQRTTRLYAEQDRREAAEGALRQALKMEAIGHLTGGVAHDFNNLLTVIIGNLEIAQRQFQSQKDGAPERLRRAVANAMHGAQRAAAVTQRLLAVSRQKPLAPEPLDLGSLTAGLSDFLRRSLGERISLNITGTEGLWRVEADPAELEAALLNLVVNARDAMPDGGELTLDAGNAYLDDEYCRHHADVRPGQYVQIAVTDTGVGMTPEVVSRAFEPFFTTKPPGQGTGLGLSQVYGFVKQSGGNLEIRSEPGKGTTVSIYLPRLAGGAAVEKKTGSAVVGGRPDETILVVEDDADVRAYVVETLRGLDYRVCEARDADGALQLIDRCGERADLLLTDVVLPGMDGRRLAEKVRQRQSAIKVLFMSGYSPNAMAQQSRLDPAVDVIQKPLTSVRLAARIREMLDS